MCSTADLSFVDFGLTYELADVVLSLLTAAPQRLRPANHKVADKGRHGLKASEVSHSITSFKEFKAPPLHTLVADDRRCDWTIRQVHKSFKPKVCWSHTLCTACAESALSPYKSEQQLFHLLHSQTFCRRACKPSHVLQGPGCNDQTSGERLLNTVTSLPLVAVGLHTMR